jgi:ribA/ribD-fused uncharacterized protein
MDPPSINKTINAFKGSYRFLSNFVPCTVYLENVAYPSVEHAYQAAKTTDLALRVAFESGTATEAKKRGSKLAIRSDWENIKISVMESLLRQKFLHGTNYRLMLDSTKGIELIEGNWWHDNFWGECYCGEKEACKNGGKNHLGKLLMQIRDET